jgi:nucleoside-diphosphate-sugar epimerase
MKKILVLGGGGFIGGHLSKRLMNEGNFVRVVDIKNHDYFDESEFCNEFIKCDLREQCFVESVFKLESRGGHPIPYDLYVQPFTDKLQFDEVYQLAADMGGAGYIFTGENDADVMHNSALINLNVLDTAIRTGVKKIFYSSSACMYPEHNQLDPNNPNCEESSAYPANPDSEYGWEKLFSERLYLAYNRNYGIDVRIARFHNIFGPYGTYKGGKEKAPASLSRKIAETLDGGEIEVWGDGKQTRSFLYIDECVEGIIRLMDSNFTGPVNIGSEEMISINDLANNIIDISGKMIYIKNIEGPTGVRGRNSNNNLIKEKIGWSPTQPLYTGLIQTYEWIEKQIKK